MNKKKTLKLLIRIAFSILILLFLFSSSDTLEVIKTVIKTDHRIWVLGVLLYILGQAISAYKWKLLAQVAGFTNSFKDYINYYFVGMFFNLFLPTTVGGDVTKCYYLSKDDVANRKAPAVYSVLAERFTGVLVVVFMAVIAMFMPIGNAVPFIIKLSMLGFAIFCAVLPLVFPTLCMKFFKHYKWARTMLKDIRIYWREPKIFALSLVWSVIFHLSVVLIHILIGHAVGIKIPYAYYFIVYPMTAIAGFLPVAFNGLGPREGTYIYFFSLAGINSSSALAFSIFWFGIVLLSSLFGGFVYAKNKLAPPPEEFDMDIDEEEIE